VSTASASHSPWTTEPEPSRPASAGRRFPWGTVLFGVILVGLGVAARFARWRNVFTTGAIELVPADSHYYIRFALRQLAHFPHFDAFDPYVNYPTGAAIYWPPLHTWIVSGFLRLFGLDQPERGAAFVDPALAAVGMAILGAVALRLYGAAAALLTLAFFALLPGSIFCSPLGNADHHVHEPFFAALTCLLMGRAIEARSVRLAVATGATLGLSRLFSPIEPLIVVPLALSCAAATLLGRRPEARAAMARLSLATGVSAAAVLLIGAIAFGNVRSTEYEPLTGFHPLFVLTLLASVAAMAQAIGGVRRWWLTGLAAVLFLIPLLPELHRAVGHLGRADPILATVDESRPLTARQALDLLSVALFGLPLAVFSAFRLIRRGSVSVLPALVASVVLAGPALKQFRFIQVLTGAVIVLEALALPALFAGLPREKPLRRALYAVVALTLLPAALWPPPLALADSEVRLVRPTLFWIRDHTPRPSPDPLGDAKPSYAVVANPMVGHFLTFWAERPAVSSTFSQAPVHVSGNERGARVFASMFEDEAYDRMVETGGRYLVVTPLLCPLGLPEVDCNDAKEWLSRYRGSFASHLLDDAGLVFPGTGHFRLVFDSVEQRERPEGGSYVRVFEAVPGAVLQGLAAPNAVVTARLMLSDNLGHRMRYTRTGRADAAGQFQLRVAYPTLDPERPVVGPAPGVTVYEVESNGRTATAGVPLKAVREGRIVVVPASTL
jgi:dolichyl-diphosphooligosaccharide--protein glycosyltransferase